MLRSSFDIPNLPHSFQDNTEGGYENEEHEINLIVKEIETTYLHTTIPYTHRRFEELELPPTLEVFSPSSEQDSGPSDDDEVTPIHTADLDAEFHKQLQLADAVLQCALHVFQSSSSQRESSSLVVHEQQRDVVNEE